MSVVFIPGVLENDHKPFAEKEVHLVYSQLSDCDKLSRDEYRLQNMLNHESNRMMGIIESD